MLYEKKNTKNKSERLKVISAGLLLLILFFELIYVYIGYPDGFWAMKFVDVANVIAQFATAGAFYLGFHQYHRNKNQERQNVLVSECKAIVSKMVAVVAEFQVGDDTNLKNMQYCFVKLGNLGSDFDEIFKALDETIQKGIVRMHWQDMYFNHFVHVMQGLELEPIIQGSSVSAIEYLVALNDAKKEAEEQQVMEGFNKYFVFKEILSNNNIKKVLISIDKISMGFCKVYFFDDKFLNDYMYGSLSRLDVRARAPLFAAIQDSL